MATKDIQERVERHIADLRRRRWYQRWWGKLLIVGGFLFLLIATIFVFETVFFYQQIKSGTTLTQTKDLVTQSVAQNLLQNQTDDPSIGSISAPVTIVAFEDFQCPHCLEAQPFLKKLMIKHAGDVRFVWKDFPLTSIHENALSAALAAHCAFEQSPDKFWEFHDQLFSHQSTLGEALYRSVAKDIGLNVTQFNECFHTDKYRKKINDSIKLGTTLGVVGTPTFFVNGQTWPVLQGYSSAYTDPTIEKLIELIKKL